VEYWIDGYNLLFFLSLEEKDFETDRQTLINSLATEYSNCKITLIFDAHHQDDEFLHITDHKNISVIFTPSKVTADAYITERLSYQKNPKVITVVSSDKGLLLHVKDLGGKTKTIQDFLKGKKDGQSPQPDKPSTDTDYELERLLKIFKEREQ